MNRKIDNPTRVLLIVALVVVIVGACAYMVGQDRAASERQAQSYDQQDCAHTLTC